jgi:hypothetical protein
MVQRRKQGKKKPAPSAAEVHPIRQVIFDTSMTASSLTSELPVPGTSAMTTASSVANELPVLGYLDEDDIKFLPPLVERRKDGCPKDITNEVVRKKTD